MKQILMSNCFHWENDAHVITVDSQRFSFLSTNISTVTGRSIAEELRQINHFLFYSYEAIDTIRNAQDAYCVVSNTDW